MLDKRYPKILWKVIKNRGGYTDSEIAQLRKAKWTEHLSNPRLANYWIRVEMVKTNRCSAGWHQGDCLYFDFTGMLITRKAPKIVCPHAIATLSPVLYSYLDRITRGADPKDLLIDHVSCTDPGFAYNGLGNNTMRISVERMPRHEYLRSMASQTKHLVHHSTKARGPNPDEKPQVPLCELTPGQLKPLEDYPLDVVEKNLFAQSDKRMKRLAAIERFKDARIALKIIESNACLAGHKVDDTLYFDSMGCLLPGYGKPVCARLVHRAWFRLIMLLDRMADDSQDFIGNGKFVGEVPDVKLGCYSAEFPLGDCGQVIMAVAVEGQQS